MARVECDFSLRNSTEQAWMVENTWCEVCGKADLGLAAPQEFEEGGTVFVEGKCKVCGTRVVTEVIEEQN